MAKQITFDKETKRQEIQTLFPTYSAVEVEMHLADLEKKYSTILQGDDVVHLDYIKGLISDSAIFIIKEQLLIHNLHLSYFDKSNEIYASLTDLFLHIVLVLNNKTIHDILLGVTTNALWETIKSVTLLLWKSIQNQSNTDSQKSSKSPEQLQFGLRAILDQNTKYEFNFTGISDEKNMLKSLEKVLKFLKEAKPNATHHRPDILIYKTDIENWEVLDLLEEIRKNQKKKKKKG